MGLVFSKFLTLTLHSHIIPFSRSIKLGTFFIKISLEEEKKKTTFLFVFLTYLPVFLLKFRSGELVGCGIKFCIQRVPTQYTFDEPRYPKNKKYLKKWNDDVIISFFQVFLVFGVAGTVKSMPSGCSLDAKFNSASNELSRSKFE